MKRMFNVLVIGLVVLSVLPGCVANKKYAAIKSELESARNDSSRLAGQVSDLQNSVSRLNQQVSELKNQAGMLSNDAANKQSQLSKSQQELAAQQRRLEQLQSLMDQQKKATADIRKKMADALVGFNSNELTVAIKNGKVYVSLQENLLFPSGSAVVNPKGKEALGKLAEVLNVNPEITVNIEGHTDSIPMRGKYKDNWDLSTARAGSIVRILTIDYKVDPIRVIASGHSQYDPVQSNSTSEGRAMNRRTEIILSPNLDELYKLLETAPEDATNK